MKRSELTFAEGFTDGRGQRASEAGATQKAFDWDKAAAIIKQHLKKHPDLVAEAGLQSDWSCTGGVIFNDGKPNSDDYTYLSSNWAVPTLIISWDGEEQIEEACFSEENHRFHSGSKWDEQSLSILNS